MPKTGGTWLRAMLIAANLNILIILIYKKYNYDLFLPLKHYGIMTFIFISIFFKRPLEALKLPAGEFEEYFTSGAYKNNLPNIRFLQIENLRQGLYDFLCGNGYEQKYIQHVKNAQPINRSVYTHYCRFYKSKAQLDHIYKLKKALFIMFPQYEKMYKEFLENI